MADLVDTLADALADASDNGTAVGNVTALTETTATVSLRGSSLVLPRLSSAVLKVGDPVVVLRVAGGNRIVLGSAGSSVRGGPAATLLQTAAQSIPNTAWTPLVWDAEDLDTHDAHSLTTNPSRFTAPLGWGGLYRVSGISVINGTAGTRYAMLAKNGSLIRGSGVQVAGGFVATPSKVVALAAGDYVELHTYQSSGAAVTTITTGGHSSALDVSYICGQ